MLVIPEIRSTPCKGIMEEDFYWKNNILPCYDVFVDKEIFLCHHSSIEIFIIHNNTIMVCSSLVVDSLVFNLSIV